MTPAEPAGTHAVADAATAWTGVLENYRASLAGHRVLLTRVQEDQNLDGVPDEPAFLPPRDLPPMPEHLHEEARALDAETEELLAAARELLAQLKPPNTTPVHRSILAPPSPSQMDTRL